LAASRGYVGKHRPVVIVQDDRFDATASVTVCAVTTDPTDAPLFRLLVEPDEVTGIRETSRLMVDKITTVPRPNLGERVGRLNDEDMVRLDRGHPRVPPRRRALIQQARARTTVRRTPASPGGA
jgi:mRNA interferase MazF